MLQVDSRSGGGVAGKRRRLCSPVGRKAVLWDLAGQLQ